MKADKKQADEPNVRPLSEPRGTRTPNQLIKSQLLYQLS